MTYRQTCTGTEEKTRGRQQQGPIFRYSKLSDADPLSDRIELEEQARTALPARSSRKREKNCFTIKSLLFDLLLACLVENENLWAPYKRIDCILFRI